MQADDVLIKPLTTEKSQRLTDRHSWVSFEVACAANKHQVGQAIVSRYRVGVRAVHTMVVAGKLKRRGSQVYRQAKWKKALVQLRPGESIDLFAGQEG